MANGDAAFRKFLQACVEAPPGARPLANSTATIHALEQQTVKRLEKIRDNAGISFVGASMKWFKIRSYVFQLLYSPSRWPTLATNLHNLLEHDTGPFSSPWAVTSERRTVEMEFNKYAPHAIRCLDNDLDNKTFAELQPYLKQVTSKSWLSGDLAAGHALICASWKFFPKERYNGSFHNIITKNPMLFVGNPFDPVTPLVSAPNVSAAFPGSAVLRHNGGGVSLPMLHTKQVLPSPRYPDDPGS